MPFYYRKWAARAAESLGGEAPASTTAKWFGGVFFPVLFAAWGLMCFVARKDAGLVWADRTAVAKGVGLIGIAVLLCAHYFFGNSRKFYVLSQLGKPVGALLAAGGILYAVFYELIFR